MNCAYSIHVYAEIHYLRLFHSSCTEKIVIDSAVHFFVLFNGTTKWWPHKAFYFMERQNYDVIFIMTSYSVDSGSIDQCGMAEFSLGFV